jgi:uncharacterized protein (DUF433 family)
MSEMNEHNRELWLPRYSYAEADHLAKVSRGTAKRWLYGYEYRREGGRRLRPPVTPRDAHGAGVSFIDLVEIVAIGQLKAQGFPLGQIRRIVEACQRFFNDERPLVTRRFRTSGIEVFVSHDGNLLEVGRRRGEIAWRVFLEPFLKNLDYEEDWAIRWWPLGHDQPIVVDPEYGFGLPVIARSGVRTEIVLERFKAGDLPDRIAEDFNVTPVDVQRALQFELDRAA